MPIKRTSPKANESKIMDEKIQRIKQSLYARLMYVGEMALTEARTNHRYQDQTGNLTSSIGYAIIDNGRVIRQSSFEQVKQGSQGGNKGKQHMKSIMAKNKQGIVFIMVAGMNYASYVEAMSLNVLDSAEMMAKRMIPQILKSLQL